jgi:hypothetical protein
MYGKPWTLTMEALRLSGDVEGLMILFADSHHIDEEQDPDPRQRETRYPDPYHSVSDPQNCFHS